MSNYVFDTGALIAHERTDRRILAVIDEIQRQSGIIHIPAGVVGQAWRDGRTQARLAQLLKAPGVHIESLTDERARAAGQLCGARGTADVIDASVVLCARTHRCVVVTSDASDLRQLDRQLRCVEV